jgi:hypothetical protein
VPSRLSAPTGASGSSLPARGDAPPDSQAQLAGEVNAAGKATGYHAELAAQGAARINPDATITRNANGTYEAPVQVWDASKGWANKPGQGSTFFPADWSRARIEFEVTEAFKKGQQVQSPTNSFTALSPSGIRIQFHWDPTNQRTVFYPPKP